MILEEDAVTQADIIVLPPSKVDDQSDCEAIDETELLSSDTFPNDVAGSIEVQYEVDSGTTGKGKRKPTEFQQPIRKSDRAKKANKRYINEDDNSVSQCKRTREAMEEDVGEETGIDDEHLEDDIEEADEPQVTKIKPATTKSETPKVHWTKRKPKYSSQPVDNEKHKVSHLIQGLITKTETELFREFFDDELIEYITDQSMKYAKQQNRHGFDLKPFQLHRFIGFLLFTGYHQLPREEMYWANAEDCNVQIVTNAMTRQTFREIKRNLHLNDNTAATSDDKLHKIRPYAEMLNTKFSKFGVFSHNVSIDEQMIPYFGRHSCKMFMRGKPVRFGFKAWCLCSSDGYLYQFLPYAGRDENFDSELGLGASVVMSLLRVVPDPQQHAIYFDNFFTSHKLMIKLRQSGFHATGTVREPRLIASELENSKSLQKKERGAYDCRFDKKNEVLVVKWNDNSVVTLATNFQAVEPVLTAKRFSRAERKVVSVTQPNVVAAYNANMGGVDLLDSFVAKYRIAVKGKKWWWPLFTNYVDVALCNAWRLHRLVHGNEVRLCTFSVRPTVFFKYTKFSAGLHFSAIECLISCGFKTVTYINM